MPAPTAWNIILSQANSSSSFRSLFKCSFPQKTFPDIFYEVKCPINSTGPSPSLKQTCVVGGDAQARRITPDLWQWAKEWRSGSGFGRNGEGIGSSCGEGKRGT